MTLRFLVPPGMLVWSLLVSGELARVTGVRLAGALFATCAVAAFVLQALWALWHPESMPGWLGRSIAGTTLPVVWACVALGLARVPAYGFLPTLFRRLLQFWIAVAAVAAFWSQIGRAHV